MELEELQSSPRFAKRCFECFARRTYVNMKKSFLPSNKRPFALTVDPTVAECIARQGFHLHILRGKTWLESLLVARALETRLRMFIMLNTLDVAPRTVKQCSLPTPFILRVIILIHRNIANREEYGDDVTRRSRVKLPFIIKSIYLSCKIFFEAVIITICINNVLHVFLDI